MNRALGHLCAHIGYTGPGAPSEDGEMLKMTLSSRHRIRNSCPGGLRSSTLPLGHGGSPQYWLSHVDGEETFFVSFKPPGPGTELRTLAWKAAVLATTLGPLPISARTRKWHILVFPANTNHLYSICTTSAQRLRRWSNIVQLLYKCFVFPGLVGL